MKGQRHSLDACVELYTAAQKGRVIVAFHACVLSYQTSQGMTLMPIVHAGDAVHPVSLTGAFKAHALRRSPRGRQARHACADMHYLVARFKGPAIIAQGVAIPVNCDMGAVFCHTT